MLTINKSNLINIFLMQKGSSFKIKILSKSNNKPVIYYTGMIKTYHLIKLYHLMKDVMVIKLCL